MPDKTESVHTHLDSYKVTPCLSNLPINEINQQLIYGQFVRLRAQSRTAMKPVIYGYKTRSPHGSYSSHLYGASDGIPFQSLVNRSVEIHGPKDPIMVDVDDLDRLLADREIRTNHGTVQVRLEISQVEALLNGSPVMVSGEYNGNATVLRLNPPSTKATADRPLVNEWHIEDLASFLVSPSSRESVDCLSE